MTPPINLIQRRVAEYFCITMVDMKSDRRMRDIARPRQIAMTLASKLTGASLPKIGRAFGGKDHTTVMYARRRISYLRRHSAEFDREVQGLSDRIEEEMVGPASSDPVEQAIDEMADDVRAKMKRDYHQDPLKFARRILATAFILFAVLAVPRPAAAQVAAQVAPGPTVCGDRDAIVKKLFTDYTEKPIAIGLASSGTLLEVFASPSGSWTIVITQPGGTSCVVAAGEFWEDIPVLAADAEVQL